MAEGMDEKGIWTRDIRKTAGSRDDQAAHTPRRLEMNEQREMEKAEEERAEKTRRNGDGSCELGREGL